MSIIFDLNPATLGLSSGDSVTSVSNGGYTANEINVAPTYDTSVVSAGAIKFTGSQGLSFGTGTGLSTALKGGSFSVTMVFQHDGTSTPDPQGFFTQAAIAGGGQLFLSLTGGNENAPYWGFTSVENFGLGALGIIQENLKPHVLTYTFTRTSSTAGVVDVYVDGYFQQTETVSGLHVWYDANNLVIGHVNDATTNFGSHLQMVRLQVDNTAIASSDVVTLHNSLGAMYGIDTQSTFAAYSTDTTLIVGAGNSIMAGFNTDDPLNHGYFGLAVQNAATANGVKYRWINAGIGGLSWDSMGMATYYTPIDSLVIPGGLNILVVGEDTNQLIHTTDTSPTIQGKAAAFYAARLAAGWNYVLRGTALYVTGQLVGDSNRIALNALRRASDPTTILVDIDAVSGIGSGNPSTTPGSGVGMNGNTLYTSDSTHPNTYGHSLIAAPLEAALLALLEPPDPPSNAPVISVTPVDTGYQIAIVTGATGATGYKVSVNGGAWNVEAMPYTYAESDATVPITFRVKGYNTAGDGAQFATSRVGGAGGSTEGTGAFYLSGNRFHRNGPPRY